MRDVTDLLHAGWLGNVTSLSQLQLLAGLSNKDAARTCFVSPETYRRWRTDRAANRTAVRLLAVLAGYVPWTGWHGWEVHKGYLFPPWLHAQWAAPWRRPSGALSATVGPGLRRAGPAGCFLSREGPTGLLATGSCPDSIGGQRGVSRCPAARQWAGLCSSGPASQRPTGRRSMCTPVFSIRLLAPLSLQSRVKCKNNPSAESSTPAPVMMATG